MGSQHGRNLVVEMLIATAGFAHEGVAPGRGQFQRAGEDALNLLPPAGGHRNSF
jgi:hypothetical protein